MAYSMGRTLTCRDRMALGCSPAPHPARLGALPKSGTETWIKIAAYLGTQCLGLSVAWTGGIVHKTQPRSGQWQAKNGRWRTPANGTNGWIDGVYIDGLLHGWMKRCFWVVASICRTRVGCS